MASCSSSVFRFCDLPREIRNQIYRELLCDFEPPSPTVDASYMFAFMPDRHTIDTAILRTSTSIYQEAYDVMVKTNRFVRITSSGGVPVQMLILSGPVPVVTSCARAVRAFNGYALSWDLRPLEEILHGPDHESSNHIEHAKCPEPLQVMIQYRYLSRFCRALADGELHIPDLKEAMQMSIQIGPVVAEQSRKRYAVFFDTFFSVITQKALLAPVLETCRGYKNVRIYGQVDKNLAKTATETMAQERWSNPKQILVDVTAAKAKGTGLFQQRELDDAAAVWQDSAVDVETFIKSKSWSAITRKGGESFVPQLAELYFSMRLNVVHIHIKSMQENKTPGVFNILANDSLTMAVQSMKQDFWMPGYKYRPPVALLAKLRYRFALFLRLDGEPGTADRALRFIDAALEWQPNDALIKKERDAILAWKARGS